MNWKFSYWFTWHPVVLENGRVAWLRFIARRFYPRGMFGDLEWEHREVDDPWVLEVGVR